MNIQYEYKNFKAPIKKVSFNATGGTNLVIKELEYNKEIEFLINDYIYATFNKEDLGQLIEVLKQFYNQI